MVEDPFVEEHQGVHRLVLSGGSDVSMHGQIGEECFDLRFSGKEVLARPHVMETDEPDNPVHIGSFGVNGVVVQAEHLSDFIEEFWLLTSHRVRHITFP